MTQPTTPPPARPDPSWGAGPRTLVFLASIVLIILFHLLWKKEFLQVDHDPLFITIDIALMALVFSFSICGIKLVDDPNKDWMFYAAVVCLVASLAWTAGWLSDYRSQVKQGIQYQYTKPKTP